jgi:hypothetical protein
LIRDEIGPIKVGRRLPNIKLFWRRGRTADTGLLHAERTVGTRMPKARHPENRKPDKTGAADRLVSGSVAWAFIKSTPLAQPEGAPQRSIA